MPRGLLRCQSGKRSSRLFKQLKRERLLHPIHGLGGMTMREAPRSRIAGQPAVAVVVPEREENDITLPNRTVSSRETQPGVPRPRVSWFKKHGEEDGVRRTPDFTEIGDPPE